MKTVEPTKRGCIAMDISLNIYKIEIWTERGIVGFTIISLVRWCAALNPTTILMGNLMYGTNIQMAML